MQPAQLAGVMFEGFGGFGCGYRCVLHTFGREQAAPLQGRQDGLSTADAVGIDEQPEPGGDVRHRVESHLA